jgi:hypothetical protein
MLVISDKVEQEFYRFENVYIQEQTAQSERLNQLRKRYKKLQDSKVRIHCTDYQNECRYLWGSDPDRQTHQV